MTKVRRRGVVIGMAASLLLPGRSWAVPPERLFADTPLAGNRVAASFKRVDLALPDVAVIGREGERRLARLAGKPLLLTLWAEWCVPCLVEARDLAGLRPQVVDDRFDIVSVLTGISGNLDYAGAVERLGKAGASGLTLLVEPGGACAIAQALSTPPASPPDPPLTLPPGARIVSRTGIALPCTLLVDRRGRVRGRASGMMAATPVAPGVVAAPHKLTDA